MDTGTPADDETEKQDAPLSPSLTAASCTGPSDNGRSTLLSVCSFIIVTEFCERLAYYGLAGSLILLLEQQLGFTNADADNQFSGWTGACYLTPLIGGWLVDSFLGRYRAILSFCTIYLAGLALLVVGVLPSRMSPTLIFAAIYLIALGTGGIKPSVSVFGAEQFDPKRERDRKELDSYFNWFYFSINLGALVSYTVVAYICQFGVRALGGERWRFALGFSIPLIAMTIAILVFISGTKRYKRLPPSGSVLTRAGHIIYQAINRHWWHRTQGQQEVASWLDQAKQRFGGSHSDPDVEGVKGVLRLVPFMLTMIPYWVVYNQMNTGFQNQGCQMDLSMGGRARIPVSTLNLFDTLAIIILIPVFDRVVYPAFKRRGRPLTMLQKIGWGFGFAVCSMVVAAVLEYHRKRSAPEEHTYLWYHEQGRTEFMESHISACKDIDDYSPFVYQQWWTERRGDPPAYCSATCDLVVGGELSMSCISCQRVPLWSPVGVLWQVPQFVLIGISEILASVTGLEFFYSEAPAEMKSFTQALYLMTTALGSWLCIALVTLSNTNERAPWVPTDLNQGYMLNFFLLLALIMLLDLTIFWCISRDYQYKGNTQSELEHHDVLADGGGGTMLTVPVAALEGFEHQGEVHRMQ